MTNSKGPQFKSITILLIVSIILVFLAIVINFYFMFSNSHNIPKAPQNVSLDMPLNVSLDLNLTQVKFSSKSIICGSDNNKHIRSFILQIPRNGYLAGIKFIAKDSNGKDYSYLNDNSSAFINSELGEKRVDIFYSQLGVDSSEKIVQLKAVPVINGPDGKQVLGETFLSSEVCYSSCNDCSLSCELICSNSTI
jgi:hypothetical protein